MYIDFPTSLDLRSSNAKAKLEPTIQLRHEKGVNLEWARLSGSNHTLCIILFSNSYIFSYPLRLIKPPLTLILWIVIVAGVAGSSNALRRQGRQRSPTIAVEVEILDIKPLETNKLVRNILTYLPTYLCNYKHVGQERKKACNNKKLEICRQNLLKMTSIIIQG